MKKKIICTIMLAALTITTLIGAGGAANPIEAYAAESKTATLSSVKVSLDGKAAASVQSYKIDGSNFIRINEAAKLLNIEAVSSTTQGKTLLIPEKPLNGVNLTTLTAVTVTVKLNDGNIAYSGNTSRVPYFSYNGDYYYRLADVIAASEKALEQESEWVKTHAPNKSYDERYMGTKSIKTFKLNWDSKTETANITTVTTDLQKLLRETRNGTGFEMTKPQAAVIPTMEMVQQPNRVDKTLQPVTPKVVPQPELTAPPAVGAQPANILIDANKGAYNADKTVNAANLTAPYKSNDASYVGQCTWYAVSRFYEVTGVNINDLDSKGNSFRKLDSAYKDLSKWAEIAKNTNFDNFTGITDIANIQARSIAVWDNHVLFVEYVERNADGSPSYIYFTEGNTGHDGIYRSDKDGKVQKMSFDKFVTRDNRSPLRGYVAAK